MAKKSHAYSIEKWAWECPICGDINEREDGDLLYEENQDLCACGEEIIVIKPEGTFFRPAD